MQCNRCNWNVANRCLTQHSRLLANPTFPRRHLRMMATPNGTTGPHRKLKILMLHGFTQTGHLFEIKTKAAKKALEKAIPPAPKPGHLTQYPDGLEFVYPTGPIKLDLRDIPGSGVAVDEESPEAYGWWRRKDDNADHPTYAGIEEGFARVADVIKAQGPFDGVIGFSQGGAAAGLVASLLDPGRKDAFEAAQSKGGMPYPESFVFEESEQPALKFAVSFSGFRAAPNPLYQAFYEPKIQTPMLHVLGSMDTVVSEERSLNLVEACADGKGKKGQAPRVVYHPGGHFMPGTQKDCISALVSFIREAVGEDSGNNGPKKAEESVEDMDVPF